MTKITQDEFNAIKRNCWDSVAQACHEGSVVYTIVSETSLTFEFADHSSICFDSLSNGAITIVRPDYHLSAYLVVPSTTSFDIWEQ